MDLTQETLPEMIEVSGREYKVHTGHSYWFRFAEILDQEKVLLTDMDFLYIGERPLDRQAGINAMVGFYCEPKELPRVDSADGERIIDYKIDSDLIYAAILQCYGVDLYDKQIHWHKVRAMISGLHGTKYNEVLGYRCAESGKNKELARMKRAWALPEKSNPITDEALKKFNEQFYNT